MLELHQIQLFILGFALYALVSCKGKVIIEEVLEGLEDNPNARDAHRIKRTPLVLEEDPPSWSASLDDIADLCGFAGVRREPFVLEEEDPPSWSASLDDIADLYGAHGERRTPLVLEEDPPSWSASLDDSADLFGAHGERRTPLVLEEDLPSRSASLEVNGNQAAYRRKRSDDMEASESVVFMPAFLKQKKKLSLAECRSGHNDMRAWKRNNPDKVHHRHVERCNGYCCYPLIS